MGGYYIFTIFVVAVMLFLHQNNTHDNNKTEDVITVKGGGLGW